MMSDHTENDQKTDWKMAVMAGLGLLLIVAVIPFVGTLGEWVGAGVAGYLERVEAPQASYEEEITEAERRGELRARLKLETRLRYSLAMIESMQQNMQLMNQAYAQAINKGVELEAQLYNRQLSDMSTANWGRHVLVGGGDVVCGIGAMFGAGAEVAEVCEGAAQVRDAIARDFVGPLDEHRSDIMTHMADEFPIDTLPIDAFVRSVTDTLDEMPPIPHDAARRAMQSDGWLREQVNQHGDDWFSGASPATDWLND